MFVGPLSGWKLRGGSVAGDGTGPAASVFFGDNVSTEKTSGRSMVIVFGNQMSGCQVVLCFSAQLLCLSKSRNVNLDL